MTNNTPIFCAVDTNDKNKALELCAHIADLDIGIKLGLEFFNSFGPQGVKEIQDQYPNTPIFLDLKYHDIPNTVAGAIRAVTNIVQPAYLNVHAAGGRSMMTAAKEACPDGVKLLAVTILTSLNKEEITEVGYQSDVSFQVQQMAKLTKDCGLDGVVCSSHEIEIIRMSCGEDFALMVPGIRPAGSDQGDQQRIMTPKDAMDKGATHLVIGRPITKADDAAQAAQDILTSLS